MGRFDPCARCGRCLRACPVYLVTKRETLSPRGRFALVPAVLDGEEIGGEIFFQCLLCGACEDACPNDVPLLNSFWEARHRLCPWPKEKLARSWPEAARVLEKGLALLGERYPQVKPFTRRRCLPPEGDVQIFLGCGSALLYPEVTEKLLTLLGALGLSGALPPGQGCCGLPALALGETSTFASLAKANLEALAGESKVITLCSSCAFALKKIYPRFFRNTAWEAKAKDLAHRVEEATGFLLGQGLTWANAPLGVLHLPCHQRFLEASPWWKDAPWNLLETCCGQGGSFALFFSETSRQIVRDWHKALWNLPFVPEVLLTNCTACYLRFKQESLPALEVRFPVEFLALP